MARLIQIDVAVQVGYVASDEFVEALTDQLDSQFDQDEVDYANFEVVRTTNVGNLIENIKWEITDKSFDNADRDVVKELERLYYQFESGKAQELLDDCVSEINDTIESEESDVVDGVTSYLEDFIPQVIKEHKDAFVSPLYLQERSDALLRGYSYTEADTVALAELIKERNAQKELAAR